jgi:O-antigen biosynthesis protein WbqP
LIQKTSIAKILLTGASGFLGKAILRECEHTNTPIRCFGRSEQPGISDYHRADLVNETLPESAFPGIETVIHSAGLAHQFGKDGNNESAFHAVNVIAVENTIRAAAAHGVSRFVLISSSGVYGPGGEFQSEDSQCQPIGPYATSKFNGEKVATQVAEETGIELVILRMTTLYGAGDQGNLNRLLHALDQKKFINIGNGSNQKSLIHKSDAARACLLAAQSEISSPIVIYNVAGQPVVMKQVLDGLCSSLKRPKPWSLPAPLVKFGSGLLSTLSLGRGPFARIRKTIHKWLANDSFDGSKFASDFGFKPQIDLAAGLANQVSHVRSSQLPVVRGNFTKRAFDLVLATVLTLCFLLPMILIAALVKFTSKGPVLFWSHRIGKDGKTFPMAKFRTMRTDTPEVATHLLQDARNYITTIGRILRKTSLDELPQLLNIIAGHMSFVGPRPSLPSQTDLNELRSILGVNQCKPGITGWAAVNGRDELLCVEKVEFDRQYLDKKGFFFDLKIIYMTAITVLKRDGVKQADESGQVPYIVIREGDQPTVLSTGDTLTAVNQAFRGQDNRIVSLRTDAKMDHEVIESAIADSSSIILTSRNDSNSGLGLNAINSALDELCETQHVVLEVPKSDLRTQTELDVKTILDQLSGRKPESQKTAVTEQAGV